MPMPAFASTPASPVTPKTSFWHQTTSTRGGRWVIAIAACANKWNTVDAYIGNGAAAAGTVDHAGVRSGVAVGLVTLYAWHQVDEVGGTALIS